MAVADSCKAPVTTQLRAGEIGNNCNKSVCCLSVHMCYGHIWKQSSADICEHGAWFVAGSPVILLTGTVVQWHATIVLLSVTVVRVLHQCSFCNSSATVISSFKATVTLQLWAGEISRNFDITWACQSQQVHVPSLRYFVSKVFVLSYHHMWLLYNCQ